MTVAVACNLSEGVILGVDSAVSLFEGQAISKIYENAEKLFQLGEKPIGVATYGAASVAGRTIGSQLREFESSCNLVRPENAAELERLCEEMRSYFKRRFDETPENQRGPFGLIVAGFSGGSYLSEVWEIQVPQHAAEGSARRCKGRGDFGSDWFAMCDPIIRYVKGYDFKLMNALISHLGTKRGTPLPAEEIAELLQIVAPFEYPIPFQAMPMEEGVRYTRFLVELVVNHHRFATGAPLVGGKLRLGMVTYRGEQFRILET